MRAQGRAPTGKCCSGRSGRGRLQSQQFPPLGCQHCHLPATKGGASSSTTTPQWGMLQPCRHTWCAMEVLALIHSRAASSAAGKAYRCCRCQHSTAVPRRSTSAGRAPTPMLPLMALDLAESHPSQSRLITALTTAAVTTATSSSQSSSCHQPAAVGGEAVGSGPERSPQRDAALAALFRGVRTQLEAGQRRRWQQQRQPGLTLGVGWLHFLFC